LVQLQYYQNSHGDFPYQNIKLFSVLNTDSTFYQMLVARDWSGIFQSQILDKLPKQ